MTGGGLEACAGLPVSRETQDQLRLYLDLLRRWSPRINLVSPNSLDSAWERHILDSAQLFPMAPANARHWLDLGSGAGFPGLVMATLARRHLPELHVTLVESDQRKCVFLAEAARLMDVSVTIKRCRIEAVSGLNADVVSARALGSLSQLLNQAFRLASPTAVMLFPKGQRVQHELTAARRHWHMDVVEHASRTNPDGVILEIRNVRPAGLGSP